MNTRTLSARALSVIEQFSAFKVGPAISSIPYWNNKSAGVRASLRVNIGKGSPDDIFSEIKDILAKKHLSPESLTGESLKKILIDSGLGIDCSGFAYYVLNSESLERGYGTIDKHIHFINCHGIIGKMRCHFRPVENCDVATFAHNKNSRVIDMGDIQPGDIITMIGNNDRDHVLIVYQVNYQNFAPIEIHYCHAIAYPEDGIYGTGIKHGSIDIIDPARPILEQKWFNDNELLLARAKKSSTELRRLSWFRKYQ